MRGLFVQEIVVPTTAIDFNGHLNNLTYLQWMQDVATAHSAAQGWDLARYRATGSSWVIRSHTVEYLRPAFAAETLLLLTWITGFAEQQSLRKYLYLRGTDRKVVARAETMWVYVDARQGRPAPIPDAFRAAFDVIPDEAAVLQLLG